MSLVEIIARLFFLFIIIVCKSSIGHFLGNQTGFRVSIMRARLFRVPICLCRLRLEKMWEKKNRWRI